MPEAVHNGFINVIHGGLLATVLDEVMVWGCAVQMKQFSYCAEMTVRYVSPARPDEAIIAEGELVENRRGRIFLASGALKREDESVICTSTGKYMPVKGGDYGLWMADFEGTPEQLRSMFGSATSS
jgi:acyl-coenzyme A thioesterase PaaI-like protein